MALRLTLRLAASCTMLCGVSSVAQPPAKIRVLLLNGNNGKPLEIGNTGNKGAPLSLTIFPVCGVNHACLFPGGGYSWRVDASGRTEVPNMEKLTGLQVSKPTDWFRYCQQAADAHDILPKDGTFNVDQMLRTGVIAPNTCNSHLNIAPHPGELVFFLRPLTTWERLTKAPQM